MLPFVGVCLDLDPFYFVFELILPSSYYRSLSTIIGILVVRYCLGVICTFEWQRFTTILLFLIICVTHTILECMKQLNKSFGNSERQRLNLYTKLQVLLISGDYFIRHLVALLLTCGQIIIITFWWISLKCSKMLPTYLIMFTYLVAMISTALAILMLPQAVEIGEISMNFVDHKTKSYHTFNRYNKNYYYYLRWKSQRRLPVRFGVQFTLNKDTPIKYFEVMMTNLTNAALLIDP